MPIHLAARQARTAIVAAGTRGAMYVWASALRTLTLPPYLARAASARHGIHSASGPLSSPCMIKTVGLEQSNPCSQPVPGATTVRLAMWPPPSNPATCHLAVCPPALGGHESHV